MFEPLSSRCREILGAIVDAYIEVGEPVSSRFISKRYNILLSPATIRNVMADLEDMGYLTQPHPSAGRVPTEKAFRYYVNQIMEVNKLTKREKEFINRVLDEKGESVTSLMQSVSKVLSILSSYTGVVVAHLFDYMVIKRIEFVKLAHKKILVIIVATNGIVQNKILNVEEDISQDDLAKFSNYLNSVAEGLSLEDLRRYVMAEMNKEKVLCDRLLLRALKLSQKALSDEGGKEVFIEGKTSVLNFTESLEIEKIKKLLIALEEKGTILSLLDKAINTKGVQIYIGSENQMEEMGEFTVVASSYGRSFKMGTLGVIGPIRMRYSKIIPLVEYTAKRVTSIIG